MVNAERLTLTLDPGEEYGAYIADNSTVFHITGFRPVGFTSPVYIQAAAAGVSTVEIEGGIFVYTDPTPRWVTIYPSPTPEPSLDVLEDLDVPLPAKITREVKGVVIARRKARFTTAFTDELELSE